MIILLGVGSGFGWKPGEITVNVTSKSEQCIGLQIQDLNKVYLLVVVYGLHTISDRKAYGKN